MNAAAANKEDCRLLAIEYGIRETARRTGINVNTLLSWSKRYNWFTHPPSVTKQNGNAISAIRPAGDIVLEELQEHERETKLSLARYSRRAAKDAEQLSVREAPLVHKVGQLAGIVHKWGEEKQSATFTLNVLNINSIEQGQE